MHDFLASLDYGSGVYDNWSDIANAANIRFGTNPAYTVADFVTVYPQFGAYTGSPSVWTGVIPVAALQVYVNLASACLNKERWEESWTMAMGLFVAHYATLYLQGMAAAGSTAAQIAAAGAAKGMQVSKSVGGVSVSYQSIVADINGWAAWKSTTFGLQLMTIGRLVGMGGMVIW